MRLLDSRRLTGPNPQTRGPAALVEVAWDAGEDPRNACDVWHRQLTRMLEALGWGYTEIVVRLYRGGAALCFTAGVDVLLAATYVNDWAVASAAAVLSGTSEGELEPSLTVLREQIEKERNPALRGLEVEAERRGIPFLLDDDLLTLGAGKRSRSFARPGPLPDSSEIAWRELGAIPVALISGTNGKTTSSRLLSRMATLAGRVPGATSTDGVTVGERLVEEGDLTGPAGARQVLRRTDIDVAILETARGGILRRGLGVSAADGALLTNVSADHLGENGIDNVAAMARAKGVIGEVVKVDTGRVVINADDRALVALAPRMSAPLVYFSLDENNPVVTAHHQAGGEVWFVSGVAPAQIVRARGAERTVLLDVNEAPLTFGGAARYNIRNVLGVAALAPCLGLDDDAVRAGLRSFGAAIDDNPGRGQLIDVRGVNVLIDFGHNPDGVDAVLGLVAALRKGGRLTIVVGLAGDRSDDDLRAVARSIHAGAPASVRLHDLRGYLRGRDPDEVPRLLQAELLRLGIAPESIALHPSETDAVRAALDEARPGDLLLTLAHLERIDVRQLLRERGAQL